MKLRITCDITKKKHVKLSNRKGKATKSKVKTLNYKFYSESFNISCNPGGKHLNYGCLERPTIKLVCR